MRSPRTTDEMLDEHLPGALRDLTTVRPDVVVFACTSAGALRGRAGERRLIKVISNRTGAHVISVAAAVRAAIAARGARRVALLTPYLKEVSEKIRASLEDAGLEVAALHGMGIRANADIAAIEPAPIHRTASECFSGASFDLLFVSCTNLRALEAREGIEHGLGVPVVTSNHAALEAGACARRRRA